MGKTHFSGPVTSGPNQHAPDNVNVGNVVLMQSKAITFADSDFTFYVPANSEIVEIYIDVTTAWDSVTSDTLEMGDGSDVDHYADAIDLQTAGRVRGTADVSQIANYATVGTSDASVVGTITSAGGSLTAGAANVVLVYAQKP